MMVTHEHLKLVGPRVLWKGIEVEHVNVDAQEEYDWEELIDRCIHLEGLGISPSSSTAVWYWGWFEDMPVNSIYRLLLSLTPGLYEHGCTLERAIELERANCHAPVVEDPDGSIAFVHRDVAVTWHGSFTRRLHYSWDIAEAQGIYHAMKAARYNMAQLGQKVFLGPCYATYDQVETWLDSHGLDVAGVVDVLRALRVDCPPSGS